MKKLSRIVLGLSIAFLSLHSVHAAETAVLYSQTSATSGGFGSAVFRPSRSGALESITMQISTSGGACVNGYIQIYDWTGAPNSPVAISKGSLRATSDIARICSSTGYPSPVNFPWQFSGSQKIVLFDTQSYFLVFDFIGNGTLLSWMVPSMDWLGNATAGMYMIVEGIDVGRMKITQPAPDSIVYEDTITNQFDYELFGSNTFDAVDIQVKDYFSNEIVQHLTVPFVGDEALVGTHSLQQVVPLPRSGYFTLTTTLKKCGASACDYGASDSIRFSNFHEPRQSTAILSQTDASSGGGNSGSVPIGQVFKVEHAGKMTSLTMRLSTSESGCLPLHLRLFSWNGAGNNIPEQSRGDLIAEAEPTKICSGTAYISPIDFTWTFLPNQQISLKADTYYYFEIDSDSRTTLPSWAIPTVIWQGSRNGALIDGRSIGGNASDLYVIINGDLTAPKIPVIIVPGIMGTEIKKGDELLWADIPRMINPFNDDGFMDPLAFNSNLEPLDTNLIIDNVLSKKTFLGKTYDYTDDLINTFTSNQIGYIKDENLFTFAYDWRFGVNETNENQLKDKINSVLALTGASKVHIVAHSTGGLLVKKYVIDHPNNHYIDKAVFVGVPNLGAPKAFKALINGDSFGVPGLNPLEMKKIAQNLPVAYDLAPSREYVDQISSFLKIYSADSNSMIDANYDQAIQEFENDHLINHDALIQSQALHTALFDNFDLRTTGINLYNIVGCKTFTFGTFRKYIPFSLFPSDSLIFDFPQNVSGDGTVPLLSAQSIPTDSDHIFFAPKADHGQMPSANGIRQVIANLLTGSNLDIGNVLTHDFVQQHPNRCQIKGEVIKIKSPVAIQATDQFNNRSGLAEDGSIENSIPGADYQIWGEHKYVFLPTGDGEQYNIDLKGTGTGTFTLQQETINDDQTTQTQVFSNIPVTPNLSGEFQLNTQSVLQLDMDSNGTIDQSLQPSAVIDANQSQDFVLPVTTAAISSIQGQSGFYRDNVIVTMTATDPVIADHEAETSGVFKTQYSLNGGTYQDSVPRIFISEEGSHTLSFFSTDLAGNNEAVQTISFTIDKTPPEFTFQFDPVSKDLKFGGTDNISSPVTVSDQDDVVTLSDQAGNQTVIKLKDKNRRRITKAEIQLISYNGIAQNLNKNRFSFSWRLDKQGNIISLSQNIVSKKEFNISAVYSKGKTLLVGKDVTGRILQTKNGLVILKVTTDKGDLKWSY